MAEALPMANSRNDLSLDELELVTDLAQAIAHLGRIENKLLTGNRKRDLEETVNRIVDKIAETYPLARDLTEEMPLPPSQRVKPWLVRGGDAASWYLAELNKTEFLVDSLDGWDMGIEGPACKEIFDRIVQAEKQELALGSEVTKRLRQAFDGFGRKWALEKVALDIPQKTLTREVRWTRKTGQRLSYESDSIRRI